MKGSRVWVMGLALLLGPAAQVLGQQEPIPAQQELTVVLVRHAEKVDDSRDAALSEAGHRRAEALAEVLADAGVTAIYTTQFQRTMHTAAPLAQRLGIEAQVIATSGAAHAADVAARVREHEVGTIVVVGHSNTVPDIIAALGGPELISGDDEYDNLFILRLTPDGVRIIKARF